VPLLLNPLSLFKLVGSGWSHRKPRAQPHNAPQPAPGTGCTCTNPGVSAWEDKTPPGMGAPRAPSGLPPFPLGHGDHGHHPSLPLRKAGVGTDSTGCWRCWRKLEDPISLSLRALKHTRDAGEFAELKPPQLTATSASPRCYPARGLLRQSAVISPSSRN